MQKETFKMTKYFLSQLLLSTNIPVKYQLEMVRDKTFRISLLFERSQKNRAAFFRQPINSIRAHLNDPHNQCKYLMAASTCGYHKRRWRFVSFHKD